MVWPWTTCLKPILSWPTAASSPPAPKENQDLFWAIRGGGANFGIVTSFLFRGCPVDQVFAGPMIWEMEHAREVMQWYREISPALPEDLYGFFAFLKAFPTAPFPEEFHNKTMC